MFHHTLLYCCVHYGTCTGVLFVQEQKYSNTGRQIISFSLSFIHLYKQYLNAPYHVKNDEFDILFASTIAIVDKNHGVVGLFYWLYRNTPTPYTPAISSSIDTTIEMYHRIICTC